jgi:hypothetical protein
MLEFLVTDLGPEEVILRLPWLKKVGAQVDFKGGNMTVKGGEQPTEVDKSEPRFQWIAANHVQQRQWMKQGLLEHDSNKLWVAAGYMHSTQLAAEVNLAKKAKTIEEMIPVEYQRYSKVFSEIESEHLPDHKLTDHAIDLKLDAPETIQSKVYPMPVTEDKAMEEFLEENLCKGYIVPSKSPMASLVFFIKKKDGKLHLIQDYWKLNDITIKNWYPLPLASDIINQLKQAR